MMRVLQIKAFLIRYAPRNSRNTSPGGVSIGSVWQPEQRGTFHPNVVARGFEGFADEFE